MFILYSSITFKCVKVLMDDVSKISKQTISNTLAKINA